MSNGSLAGVVFCCMDGCISCDAKTEKGSTSSAALSAWFLYEFVVSGRLVSELLGSCLAAEGCPWVSDPELKWLVVAFCVEIESGFPL